MGKPYLLLVEDAPTEVVELAGGKGKRFIKQLVKFDTWVHPHGGGKKMKLDRAWGEKVAENFKKGFVGRVPVPVGHPMTSADLSLYNKGELVNLEVRRDGLWGMLEIRDEQAAKDVVNDLLWDVSVQYEENYQDKKTGSWVGPVLRHVGLVNDPWLRGMEGFQSLANTMNAIMLSEGDNMAVEQITNDRDFEVTVGYEVDGEAKELKLAPGESAEVPSEAVETVKAEMAAQKAPEAPAPEGEDAEGEGETPPPAAPAEGELTEGQDAKVGELEAENERLRSELSLGKATTAYDALLSEGKIVPAQKDAFIALSTAPASTISLSDGSTKSSNALLADLFKAFPKRISFSEEGTGGDEDEQTPYDKLSDQDKEVQRKLGVEPEAYNKVNAEEVTVN